MDQPQGPPPSFFQGILQTVVSALSIPPPIIKPLVLLHGERPPAFFPGTYVQAVAEAKNRYKFLLVYLHSQNHLDTPRFLREVLCSPNVSTFLENNFVLWGGDVQTEEAYQLVPLLGATTFPFFALIGNFDSSASLTNHLAMMGYANNKIVHKIQGYIPSDSLIPLLQGFVDSHEHLLVLSQVEVEERQRSRNLVETQNDLFAETARQDRENFQRREQEEQRRQQEEARQQQEKQREEERRQQEEERQQQEKQREEQLLQQKKIRIQEKQQRLQSSLPPEPEKGPNVITLMIRFSNGAKASRRFSLDEKLKVLFEFIESREDLEEFIIGTHYPKKIFTNPDITMREAELPSQAVIYVDLPDL